MNPRADDSDVVAVLAVCARFVAAPASVEVGPKVVAGPGGNTILNANSSGELGVVAGDYRGATGHAIVEKRTEVGVMAIADVVAEVDVCNGFRLEVV